MGSKVLVKQSGLSPRYVRSKLIVDTMVACKANYKLELFLGSTLEYDILFADQLV